jgi:GAF domain-containing protein
LEASYRTTTQKAWRTHLKNTHQRLAYRYHNAQLENAAEDSPHGQEALYKGQPVLKVVKGPKDEEERATTVFAVPIKLRNQVLGVVDIHFQGTNVSPDLISLIEGTVNRLAISLENARLLEEIQYRAERERLVSEISSKVRAASDVDSVLKIAIQEIGRSLGVSEVMVQLRKDS